MAFMSSSNNNTSSTNRAINTAQTVNIAHRVSTASTQVNDAYSTNINNLSDVVIYGFEMANGHVDYEGKKVFEEYRKESYFPPPYTGNFMPPTPDLSFIGLDEFVNKPVVENCKVMFWKNSPRYHVYSISIQLSHSRQMDGKAVVKVSLLELSWNSKAVEYPNVIKDVEENLQCQSRKETELIKDYILLPLWTADPPYSQDPKSSHDDGSKPSSDDGKKVDEDLRKENECNDQEKGDNVNNVNNVNAAAQNKVNAVVGKKALNFPFDLIMPVLLEKGVITYLTSQEIMKDDGSVAA
ncbi:hypothetical protein Tco_0728576 [Tanacetum coccineum]|uniref:Uncharacterized protein n=1 Tax=Tanacetum coccineum TaxID=301880 RepID=A0ABQ4YME6_9ASTR